MGALGEEKNLAEQLDGWGHYFPPVPRARLVGSNLGDRVS